jgi:hypothetical protein
MGLSGFAQPQIASGAAPVHHFDRDSGRPGTGSAIKN